MGALLPCLVSHPRSGRTWLRMMALHALNDTSEKGEKFQWTHRGRFMADRDAVILVREPKDIITSYYFYYNFNKPHVHDSYANVSDFIRGPRGVSKLIGQWKNFAKYKHVAKQFSIIYYEDMVEDPKRELTRFLVGIGHPQSPKKVKAAVEATTFDKLVTWEKLDVADMRSRKFRRGKIGDYKNHLTKEDIAYIDSKFAELTDEERWWRYGR